MSRDPITTRQRILRAADEVATETGHGAVSLEAVAARAGVSKGGLLYHFPTKAALLQALVEDHLLRIEARLTDPAHGAVPNGMILAALDHFESEWHAHDPRGGLLAALAESPSILAPVAAAQTRMLAQIRANASDPALAELAFHALQGWRSGRLLGICEPPEGALSAFLEYLRARLKASAQTTDQGKTGA